MNNAAIIIVAAGSSSRFGSLKQLLQFQGKTLLQHVVDEAINAHANTVVVVTGAAGNEVLKGINAKKATIVSNEKWEEGMASSIVVGVKKAIALNKDIESIIISVCDQPFISANLFEQLYRVKMANEKNIVASSYADTIGTPALFTKKYFDALMSLRGDEGAKKIIKSNSGDVMTVDFRRGNIDIDTKEDYQKLLKGYRES